MKDQTTQATVDASPSSTGSAPASGASQSPPQSQSSAPVVAPQTPLPPVAPSAPQRPEGLADDYWDAEKNAVKFGDVAAHLKEFSELRKANEERAAQVPKDGAYELKLPADVQLPDGFAINEADPLLSEWKSFATENQLTQEQFSKALAMDLKVKQAQHAALQDALKQRDAQLGPNGAARVDALRKFFDAQAGGDAALASQLKDTLWTPQIIGWMEAVQNALVNQGVGALTRASGAPPASSLPANWGKMTFEQRMAWHDANNKPAR